MAIDERVLDVLMRYEELAAQGQTVDFRELCGDSPELLAEVEQHWHDLQQVNARLTPPADGAVSGLTEPPGYEILGELGRGGMGVVYLARHVGLDRLVALKMILHADYAGPAMRERFHAEARALARVRHPNIVPIHEVGEHQGKPFFALEYCGGGSLAQQLGGKPQPPSEAAALVELLARAIHAAHQSGVIHRDLKPGNVLLAEEKNLPPRRQDAKEERQEDKAKEVEEAAATLPPSALPLRSSFAPLRLCGRLSSLTPKITDFGLAKRLDQSGQTVSGEVLGTPSYMVPEQARGDSKDAGPATDVYALGAILFECLTGRPPFKGPSAADVLVQVVADEPAAPRRLQPGVPLDLETICLKCLSKEPDKRYPSAEALADDLRAFLDGRSIQARPAMRWERAWKWCKRRPAAALAGLFLLLALLGAAGGLWQWRRAEAARLEKQQREQAEQEAAQVHVEYFKNFVRRNGVLDGVGPVWADEVPKRFRTLKFYRRAGRVLTVEIVNGHDQPMPNLDRDGTIIEGINTWSPAPTPCAYEFHYSQAGEVIGEVGRTRAGQAAWSFTYTSPTTGHFTDDRGYVRPGKGSEAAYVKFIRTADGLEKEHHYLDSGGRPQPSTSGVYGRRFRYDSRGLEVEATWLDERGKPATGKGGYSTEKKVYDEQGNLREVAFFGPDGKAVLHQDGYAGNRQQCDPHGNVIETSYFGVDGKPTLHKDGVAVIRIRWDNWGNPIEVASFGVSGKPVLRKDGFHMIRFRHDERGNAREQAYFSPDGKAVLHKDGFHRIENEFDELGNLVGAAYFDTNGKPTLHKDGYARVRWKHDGRGRRIEQSYFGTDDRPTVGRRGVSIMRFRFDERGNLVARAFFDRGGKPTLHRDGYHRIESRYDKLGNLEQEAYFGTDDRPTLDKDGSARIHCRYDERGNRIEAAYFDIDGKPALRKSGATRIRWKYDKRGNKVEQTLLDPDGRPIANKNGVATLRWLYDERGNQIEETYLDANGKPTRSNGIAKAVLKYDERGNKIATLYLGFDDKPTAIRGIAEVRWQYDEHGNKIEEARLGPDGTPRQPRGSYARIQWQYDERGNKIGESYLDARGKPMLVNGFARAITKYDLRGNKVEISFLDFDGKPVPNPDGIAIRRWQYDERGNQIEEAFFDASGRRACDGAGCARITWKHDERGNRTEEAYFDRDGKPVLYNGVARMVLKWDGRGNKIEMALFDAVNKPVHFFEVEGYSGWTARYDNHGRLLQKTFRGDRSAAAVEKAVEYNQAGNPMTETYQEAGGKVIRHPRLGYARRVSRYDDSGRTWLGIGFFDESGRPVKTKVFIRGLVPGEQAVDAGLLADDAVLSYDGKPVRFVRQFIAAIGQRAAGGKSGPISMQVRRRGKDLTFSVRPGKLGINLEDRASD